jgi:hypothetical protein
MSHISIPSIQKNKTGGECVEASLHQMASSRLHSETLTKN